MGNAADLLQGLRMLMQTGQPTVAQPAWAQLGAIQLCRGLKGLGIDTEPGEALFCLDTKLLTSQSV